MSSTKKTVAFLSTSALAASAAHGAISYTPLNITVSSQGTFALDLNQDGYPDFQLGFNGAAKPFIDSTNSPITTAFVLSDNSTQGLPLTGIGATINASYESAQAAGYFNKKTTNNTGPTVGGFSAAGNNEGYVGLELTDGTGTHYGWAHFIYNATAVPATTADTGTLTLVDAAIETAPGVSIQAGQTAELGDTPSLVSPPAPQTGYLGGTVQLTAIAEGFPAPAFRWQAGIVGSGVYTNLPSPAVSTDGAISKLTLRNLTAASGADYVVVVSNASGVITSAPATVTVLPASDSPAVLVHRYSFQDPAGSSSFVDSVGGTNWTGYLSGSASLTGNSLVLDGSFGCYAVLPPNITSNYNQMTVEFWADVAANNPVWTRVFSFGDNSGGTKNSGLDYCPSAGGNYQNLDLKDIAQVDSYANDPTNLLGSVNAHVTAVADSVGGSLYFYNGTNVVSVLRNEVTPLAQINDIVDSIGQSLVAADPYLAGTIHEFRVYSGVLSAQAVGLNDAVGPSNYIQLAANPTLSAHIAAGNIVLSWPVSDFGFSVQARSGLGSGTSWAALTNAPVLTGTNWQVSLPDSGAARYFQLSHP